MKNSKRKYAISLKNEIYKFEKSFKKIRENFFKCPAIKEYEVVKKDYPTILPRIRQCIDSEKKNVISLKNSISQMSIFVIYN